MNCNMCAVGGGGGGGVQDGGGGGAGGYSGYNWIIQDGY